MRKIAFFLAMLLMPCVSFAGLLSSSSPVTPVSKEYKQQLMGSPVYIQIFKEERTLDLYVKMGEQYQLLDSYKICNYSGGLGPKRRQGDFKSPEGFYSVQRNQLKPAVGCYAMTDSGIDEIFQFVTAALVFGQPSVQVSIYPFRMTDANMQRHKYSYYKDFWAQLKPGYDYFEQTHKPPTVSIVDGRYVVSKPLSHEVVQPQLASNYTLSEAK
ncbi:transpeptidase [Salmonella enterica subsp. enterica serovar Typhimurium]|nr:transpeptidase [Salmonella enterica subsp. enterica serovar Typhimurium]